MGVLSATIMLLINKEMLFKKQDNQTRLTDHKEEQMPHFINSPSPTFFSSHL